MKNGDKLAVAAGPDTVGGLTKRELFAAMAMQGLLASGDYDLKGLRDAVRCADALLEALAEPTSAAVAQDGGGTI